MKYALGIEYDGTRYFGWQAQKSVASLQITVEKALSLVAAAPIQVQCAGRTDRGVHATQQVIHFETDVDRSEKAWLMGTNTHLPSNIRVVWAKAVPVEFHARFSATARRYHYIIYNSRVHSAILRHAITWHHVPLDADKMRQGIKYLLGEHDFSSFRAAGCQAKHGIRDMLDANVARRGEYIIVDIQANAFLHHMVRNIVGALFKVGEGEHEPLWIQTLLQQQDRTKAGVTAPPQGLYLIQVTYPEFDVPQTARIPLIT